MEFAYKRLWTILKDIKNDKKFGIIGNPIKHSLSPVLHNYWFKKYNIDANYSIIDLKDENNLPRNNWPDKE